MRRIIDEIVLERKRQDEKWGVQKHELPFWMTILGEEFGEVCAAIQDETYTRVREELIQVAAVAVAAIEDIDGRIN